MDFVEPFQLYFKKPHLLQSHSYALKICRIPETGRPPPSPTPPNCSYILPGFPFLGAPKTLNTSPLTHLTYTTQFGHISSGR